MPSMTRPSASVTSTPSAVRTAPAARDRDMTVMPRALNTSSSSWAASASSPGRTRSRLETRTTSAPSDVYAPANSAPVTPEPTTISFFGQLVQVVQLGPGEDPLAVRLGLREHPRGGPGRDEDGVGVERHVVDTVGCGHQHPRRSVEPAAAEDDPHALALEAGPDVRRLRRRERLDAGVHGREVDAVPQAVQPGRVERGAVEPDAELGRAVRDRHPLGGGDEGLRRDDVGEDGRPTQTGGLDDRHLGAEAATDQRGLVAARSAADDDDAGDGGIVRRGAHRNLFCRSDAGGPAG